MPHTKDIVHSKITEETKNGLEYSILMVRAGDRTPGLTAGVSKEVFDLQTVGGEYERPADKSTALRHVIHPSSATSWNDEIRALRIEANKSQIALIIRNIRNTFGFFYLEHGSPEWAISKMVDVYDKPFSVAYEQLGRVQKGFDLVKAVKDKKELEAYRDADRSKDSGAV